LSQTANFTVLLPSYSAQLAIPTDSLIQPFNLSGGWSLELNCHYDHKVPLFLFTALNLMSQFNLENATLYSQSKGDADTDEVTEVYS